MRAGPIASILLLAAVTACRGEAPPGDGPETAGGPAPPLVSSQGEALRPEPGAEEAPGLGWQLPRGWEPQPPATRMRLAQARIPGPGGAGEVAVFHFGAGGGGGLEANLERWARQVETAPGAEPRRQSFTVGELRVTWLEARGTLKASPTGMGPPADQPGFMLLGAVVEGPGGPWFVKAIGPEETLAAEREPFLEFLRSLRVD